MAFANYQGNDEFEPVEYRDEDDIPFLSDGMIPQLGGAVDKVKGISGRFQGMKCSRKTLIWGIEDPSQEDAIKRQISHEVKVLHYARHPHVVRLVHSYFANGSNNATLLLAVIMERADGNLRPYLKPEESHHKGWFSCLMTAVHYIHALGIRHRDIKPENILVKGETILLADFGLSHMGLGQTIPTTNLKRSSARSRQYCAPEVDEGRTRGRSADIFSLGAVFLEMLITYTDAEKSKELQDILKPSPRHQSSYAQSIDGVHRWIDKELHFTGWRGKLLDVCQRMLHKDRLQRPTAESLKMVDWPSLTSHDQSMNCTCERTAPSTKGDQLARVCRSGLANEATRLLADGADPNAMNAIHFASECGSTDIVRLLLDGGAHTDAANPARQTALHCAARSGSEGTVGLLLERGANVNATDENDQTPLHGAAAQGHPGIVQKLLDANADVEAEDKDAQTALEFATRRQSKTDIKVKDNNAQAAYERATAVVNLLQNHLADAM